jgi:hypothetical protein
MMTVEILSFLAKLLGPVAAAVRKAWSWRRAAREHREFLRARDVASLPHPERDVMVLAHRSGGRVCMDGPLMSSHLRAGEHRFRSPHDASYTQRYLAAAIELQRAGFLRACRGEGTIELTKRGREVAKALDGGHDVGPVPLSAQQAEDARIGALAAACSPEQVDLLLWLIHGSNACTVVADPLRHVRLGDRMLMDQAKPDVALNYIMALDDLERRSLLTSLVSSTACEKYALSRDGRLVAHLLRTAHAVSALDQFPPVPPAPKPVPQKSWFDR